ncbi:MAG: MoaD/ThiS family protein, partial [Actinomycetota bacterium]
PPPWGRRATPLQRTSRRPARRTPRGSVAGIDTRISIVVMLFAPHGDGADHTALTVRLAAPATVADLHARMAEELSLPVPPGARVAVNGVWATPATDLEDGDSVAVVLPCR